MLKEVTATRYITPLRESGSLPGLVEADDLGTYVMKFTGVGQGRKTLVAEVLCGELAGRLGLRVPGPSWPRARTSTRPSCWRWTPRRAWRAWRAALRAVEGVCAGGEAAGQAARDDAGRRFRWLIALRSTVVQPGPVHTGLATGPGAEAERLLDLLVR